MVIAPVGIMDMTPKLELRSLIVPMEPQGFETLSVTHLHNGGMSVVVCGKKKKTHIALQKILCAWWYSQFLHIPMGHHHYL